MKPRKSFVVFVAVFSILALGLVFIGAGLIDSPAVMKLRKLDNRRASDIKGMAMAVADFYKKNNALPQKVTEVTVGRFSLADPVTSISYPYRVVSEHMFALCATFATSNLKYGRETSFYVAGTYYQLHHDKGQTCFEFDALKKDAG